MFFGLMPQLADITLAAAAVDTLGKMKPRPMRRITQKPNIHAAAKHRKGKRRQQSQSRRKNRRHVYA